jgi:hypothetical protein
MPALPFVDHTDDDVCAQVRPDTVSVPQPGLFVRVNVSSIRVTATDSGVPLASWP